MNPHTHGGTNNPSSVWAKINYHGIAGFSPWFHLPGFHFKYDFLTRSPSFSPQHGEVLKHLVERQLGFALHRLWLRRAAPDVRPLPGKPRLAPRLAMKVLYFEDGVVQVLMLFYMLPLFLFDVTSLSVRFDGWCGGFAGANELGGNLAPRKMRAYLPGSVRWKPKNVRRAFQRAFYC